MLTKNTIIAFDPAQPDRFWTGDGWRQDRRAGCDPRLGRRSSDSHFPYNPSFVAQALAQGAIGGGGSLAVRDGGHPAGYGARPEVMAPGHVFKLDI